MLLEGAVADSVSHLMGCGCTASTYISWKACRDHVVFVGKASSYNSERESSLRGVRESE